MATPFCRGPSQRYTAPTSRVSDSEVLTPRIPPVMADRSSLISKPIDLETTRSIPILPAHQLPIREANVQDPQLGICSMACEHRPENDGYSVYAYREAQRGERVGSQLLRPAT
jgi:hypothetical protein